MTSDQAQRLQLQNVFVIKHGACDVDIQAGRISRIVDHKVAGQVSAQDPSGVEQLDLTGYVLLPAPAEPHAHLDKALLGTRVRNENEDLEGAIAAILSEYRRMDAADVNSRASEAIRQAVARGYTAVRTHVDCRSGIGIRSVEELADLRDRLRDVIDVQIVALAGHVIGAEGSENRALLEAGLRVGADLVGGVPALEEDSEASVRELMAIARQFNVGMDLHIDETLDPRAQSLRSLAEQVINAEFVGRVTASHCVSLSEQPISEIEETAARVAEAGIGVVALPQTNLYLQGRDRRSSVPRGITPISLLEEAGVAVAAGGDNWRDPFNPMGRIDPMETASLMVSAGHQRVARAYERVSTVAREVMGLEPVSIEVGAAATLLAIRAQNLEEAVGGASDDRIVLRDGVVVARTRVATEFSTALHDATSTPRR